MNTFGNIVYFVISGSSADSSIGGSLLAQCSNSATVTSPAATGAESGHCRYCLTVYSDNDQFISCSVNSKYYVGYSYKLLSTHFSGLTSASVTSTEESTPGTKTNQTGDGLQSIIPSTSS